MKPSLPAPERMGLLLGLLREGEEGVGVVKANSVAAKKVAAAQEVKIHIETSRNSEGNGESVFADLCPKPMKRYPFGLASAGGDNNLAGLDF